ncbi:BCCT family transporter [Saccharopolyspora sp. CA-218241]|uniref:BCCT family transporter n=1 Tax=Saccharopolyspora sp. CA-218241 TaxID=3240027 RepID=UPI003D958FB5
MTEPDKPHEQGDDPTTGEPELGAREAEAKGRTDIVVFGVTALITVFLVTWGVASTDTLSTAANAALSWLVTNIGWGYVLAATGFVIFALWLAFSRYGAIPLGADDEGPEFRTVSWIAMMFSAGMGIGLMFFGVAEPLSHFVEPPPRSAPPLSDDAVETAMATSLFHWTLHPWSIYAVVGLAIAYGSFRRGRKQLISAAFTPLLGAKRAEGPIGRLIDILALFATLFGSAASLGLGTLQIQSGMQAAGWIGSVGTTMLVLIIVVLTICFVVSAVSGVARGIQWLSNINMVLAALLAFFLFVVGPTVFILDLVPLAIGDYVRDFGEMVSRSGATGGAAMNDWLSSWTIFYWAWWISWTPFVGMFIARISRGRTIRQFVGGVILVPSVVSIIWFAILGGSAINAQAGGVNIFGSGGEEAQTFAMLETLPISTITTVLVMILVAIFFVSGADAASVVMGTLSQRGSIDPNRAVVVFWGAATGGVAAIMLIVGGEDALSGIQNLTFIASVPFAVVMILLCVSLVKDLRDDPMTRREELGAQVLEQAVISGTELHGGDFQLDISAAEDTEEEPGEESGRDEGGSEGSRG